MRGRLGDCSICLPYIGNLFAVPGHHSKKSITNKLHKMRKLLVLTLAFAMVTVVQAQKKKQKEIAGYTAQNYEITCIGVGNEGTKLIAVYGYGKDPERATYEAKRNAIHGVIFKGTETNSGGCMGVKPLAASVSLETERRDFFEKFFADGGLYLNFISLSGESQANRTVTKIDKKTYKVGTAVAVRYDALRKELENAGVIKKLSSGF